MSARSPASFVLPQLCVYLPLLALGIFMVEVAQSSASPQKGGVAGGVGARAYEGFEVGFSLCSVAGIILLGVGSDPYLQEQKP